MYGDVCVVMGHVCDGVCGEDVLLLISCSETISSSSSTGVQLGLS